MSFFIILIILCVLLYIFAFNSRDKSQDYKLYSEYTTLSREEKVEKNISKGLEDLVNDTLKKCLDLKLSKEETKIVVIKKIEERREKFLNNLTGFANQENISVATLRNIVNINADEFIINTKLFF